MASLNSSACAVCFHDDGHDRRLLECLHSFCASCIDQLVLSKVAEGHQHEVACPLCRTRTRLPKNGVDGLPKDTTKRVEEELQCETCKEEALGEVERPAVWCSTCKCALCYKHLGRHMSSGAGYSSHSVGDLPKISSREVAGKAVLPICSEHNAPL